MKHELKTWPGPFEAVLSGAKRFEIRRDDGRGFAVGDQLLLREYVLSDEHYTGRAILTGVTHIERGWGLHPDVVVMGIRVLDPTAGGRP